MRDESNDITPAENTAMQVFLEAVGAAKKHAKEIGLGRGNPGTGALPCPACKTGTLRYSVASSNGHMHAVCSTPNCVRFLE